MSINSNLFVLVIIFIICAKLSEQNNVYKPLTPSEWAQRFRCEANATGEPEHCQRNQPDRWDYCRKEEDVCLRHPGDWMWKYVDEMTPEFGLLVRESSIDERLANIIYTTVTTRELDGDLHKISAKDAQLQLEFEQRLVVGPQVNYTRCGEHLASMLKLADQFRDRLQLARSMKLQQVEFNETFIRLARVLDSNGRYSSGSLSGKYYYVGAYDQCINSQLLLGDHQQQQQQLVAMRMCSAGLSVEANVSPELLARQRFAYERGAIGMQVFVCLPETCHSKSLDQHRDLLQRWIDIEFQFPESIYVHQKARLTSLSCMVDRQSPMTLPTSGRILLGLLGLWMVLIIYATYRRLKQESQAKSWTKCMSLVDNWKDLMEIRPDQDDEGSGRERHNIDLDLLNPIKVISCLGATVVHAFMAHHIGSNNLLRDHKKMESDPFMAIVLVSPLMIETYFVLSGLLTTYLALKRVDKLEIGEKLAIDEQPAGEQQTTKPTLKRCLRGSLDLVQKCTFLIASRYSRLLPLIYLVFWFKKGVFIYSGSGPLFNFGLNKDAGGQCHNESWWSLLWLGSVYEPLFYKCLPQSYTVTSDMIFVILIAPIIFLINKHPRLIVGLVLVLSSWSSWASLRALLDANTQLTWNMLDLRVSSMIQLLLSSLGFIYVSPEYRLFSILFGVLAGWLIYRYDGHTSARDKQTLVIVNGARDKTRRDYWHPKWLIDLATWAAIGLPVSVAIVTAYHVELKSLIYPHHRQVFPFVYMAGKILWALASALVCLRLLTDWAEVDKKDDDEDDNVDPSWLRRMARLRFWRIMAKLNYPILLIHLDLLLLDWQLQLNESPISTYRLLTTQAYAHTSSIVLGIIVHVLIESPIDKLVKTYLLR